MRKIEQLQKEYNKFLKKITKEMNERYKETIEIKSNEKIKKILDKCNKV